jgi:hypothetical protein
MTDETKSVPAQSPDDDELIGLNARLADALDEIRHLKAALSGNAQGHGLTAEDVYVNCQTTLMGFEVELNEQTRHFICDQISRKVMLAISGNAGAVEATQSIYWHLEERASRYEQCGASTYSGKVVAEELREACRLIAAPLPQGDGE